MDLELELVNTVFSRPPYISLRNILDTMLVYLTNQFVNERTFVGSNEKAKQTQVIGLICFLLTCLYLSLNGKPFSDLILCHLFQSKTLIGFLKTQYIELAEVSFN